MDLFIIISCCKCLHILAARWSFWRSFCCSSALFLIHFLETILDFFHCPGSSVFPKPSHFGPDSYPESGASQKNEHLWVEPWFVTASVYQPISQQDRCSSSPGEDRLVWKLSQPTPWLAHSNWCVLVLRPSPALPIAPRARAWMLRQRFNSEGGGYHWGLSVAY